MANSIPFANCVLSIVDSHDKFGLWSFKSKEEKLNRYFLLDSDAFKGMDTLCGANSEPIRRQATFFFQAVAMSLEIQTGIRICSIVELDDEGLGRAVLYSGRLVLSVHGWRQGQFGFTTMEEAEQEGRKRIAEALEWLEKYPDLV